MSFFDQLFRGARPQTPLDAVRQAAKASLATFVSERLVRFPGQQRFFETGRTHVILGHHCAEFALRRVTENPIGVFTPLLAAIQRSPFRNLQRFFVTIQLMLMYRDVVADPDGMKSWMYLLSEGACDTYSQPFSVFSNAHARYLASNEEHGAADYPAAFARAMNSCMDELYSDLMCGEHNAVGTMTVMMTTIEVMNSLTEDTKMATRLADAMLRTNWGS